MWKHLTVQFVALRGIQAGREYYVVMCPLKLIPKIFLFDEEEIPAELRSQRTLNKARIPDISQYLVDNPESYIFSSITVSIDAEVKFEPMDSEGFARDVGVLTVPMQARFLINDGQHRRAAIEEALKENPDLGDETISAVFFIDAGLERSQQFFADLNKHAVRPTKSISILYDHRDPLSQLAVELINQVPIFKGRTETEKGSISNRSTKLFTLSAIYQATQALLEHGKSNRLTKKKKQIAYDYWYALSEIIPEWRLLIKNEVSSAHLRQEYIHSHGVALSALGIMGAQLIKEFPDTWYNNLEALGKLDWSRTNVELWEGRAMISGRMSKASNNVKLTVNLLKQVVGLSLNESELELEELLNLDE